MAVNSSTTKVIYAALIGNLLVAFSKTGAAAWTNSSSMLSEAVYSFVDIGNQVLCCMACARQATRRPRDHPIGYGRELYFWSFIVALLVFALGTVVSIYHGILHIKNPEHIHDAFVNYVVLALAFVFEGASWWFAVKHFRAVKGTLQMPAFDGAASILIGVMLAGAAGLLARESKSLLIGERADRNLSNSLLSIAEAASLTSKANGVLTVQLAPDQILAALSIEFTDSLKVPEVEAAVVEIERQIKASHSEVVTLFIKPQTTAAFKEQVKQRFGKLPPKLI
jgi:divalent metal cation (Fe/Co/Zn/Cd) transporter